MNIEDLKKNLIEYEEYLERSQDLINIQFSDKELNHGIEKIKKDRQICQEKIIEIKAQIKDLTIKDTLSKYNKEVLIDFILNKLDDLSDHDKNILDSLASGKKIINVPKINTVLPINNIKSMQIEKTDKKNETELEKIGKKTHELYSNFLKLEKDYKDLELKIKKEKDITAKNKMKDKAKILDFKIQMAWDEYQKVSKEYSDLIQNV